MRTRLVRRLHQATAGGDLWKCTTVVFWLGLAMALWNGTMPGHTFMGDDLALLAGTKTGDFPSAGWPVLSYTIVDRYRPVPILALALAFQAFGTEFRWYLYLNWLIQFVNVLIISWIAFHFSGRRWHVAAAVGLAAIVSRFAYYFTFQVVGLLEVLALLLLLVMIAALVRAYQQPRLRTLSASIGSYFLLLYTHERFVVVGGFLCLAIAFWPGAFRPRYRRWLWIAAPALAPLSVYFAKVHVLHVPMFVGAGGGSAGFNPPDFFAFLWAGLQNLVGFNAGPAYLSGLDWRQAGIVGVVLGLIVLIPIASLLIEHFVASAGPPSPTRLTDWRNVVLCASLLGPLLAAASITIRQEFRWLMAPHVVFLLALAHLYGRRAHHARIRLVVGPLLLLGILGVDAFYRSFVDNVYFMSSLRISDGAKTRIIDNYGAELAEHQVYLVATNPDIRQWVLQDDQFFSIYSSRKMRPVRYVSAIANIPLDEGPLEDVLVFDATRDDVRDVTVAARKVLLRRTRQVRFDFVKEHARGLLNDRRDVATPTRLGAFVMGLPNGQIWSEGLTVLSGFRLRYERIRVEPVDSLWITAAMPYRQGDGARAYVEVSDGIRTNRVVSLDLSPAPRDFEFRWRFLEVPLRVPGGRDLSVTVGAESPTGDPTADWVVFGALYVGAATITGGASTERPREQ